MPIFRIVRLISVQISKKQICPIVFGVVIGSSPTHFWRRVFEGTNAILKEWFGSYSTRKKYLPHRNRLVGYSRVQCLPITLKTEVHCNSSLGDKWKSESQLKAHHCWSFLRRYTFLFLTFFHVKKEIFKNSFFLEKAHFLT